MKVPQDDLPTAHTLWLSPEVGPIHAACLKSLGAVGQRVIVHCYKRPAGLPENVEVADAALIVPKRKAFRHIETGLFAPFADVFRYLLLRSGADMWIDSDMFAIKPIRRRPYLFGFETPGIVNQAVLALPRDSPLLRDLVNIVTNPLARMPWISRRWLWRARIRALRSRTSMIAYLPWATVGPTAISYLAKKHNVMHHALPVDAFYPVGYENLYPLLDPGRSLNDLITPTTEAVHLYGTALTRIIGDRVPAGSPLADILGR
jgi:hypothetical protein